jgi:hypothetical protein
MRIAHKASHLDANSPEFAPSPKFVPARDRSASHTLQGDAVLEVDVERSMENAMIQYRIRWPTEAGGNQWLQKIRGHTESGQR